MEAYVAPGDRRVKGTADAGREAVLPSGAARAGHGRLQEPGQALVARLHGGLLHQAARRPRAAREVQRGADRELRVPGRRGRARNLEAGDVDGAREAAAWYADVFKDRYYLEVQAHDSEGQAELNAQIFKLGDGAEPARRRDERRALPPRRRPRRARRAALHRARQGLRRPETGCTTTGASTSRALRRCASRFPERPDVLENTLRIADEAGFAFEKKYYVPSFPLPPEVETRERAARDARDGGRAASATAIRAAAARCRSGSTTSSASSRRRATPATS